MEELEHHMSILTADYVPPKPEMSPIRSHEQEDGEDDLLSDASTDNENDPARHLSPVKEAHQHRHDHTQHHDHHHPTSGHVTGNHHHHHDAGEFSPETGTDVALSAAEVLKKKLDDAERMFASWLE